MKSIGKGIRLVSKMIILVVDGYNMIGAWDELKHIKQKNISEARDRLVELLADYQAYTGQRVIVVFDAYYVPGIETRTKIHNVDIIYTKENETADECIERLVPTLTNVNTKVYVATSDYTEQRIIFGKGALRKSAQELYLDVKNIKKEITDHIKFDQLIKHPSKITLKQDVLDIFEKWRRGDA